MIEEELEQVIADLKAVRNDVFIIGEGSNPWVRNIARKNACTTIHDITEKYKALLREAQRKTR